MKNGFNMTFVSIVLLFCITCSAQLVPSEINYESNIVEGVKPWVSKQVSDFHGDYYFSSGTAGGSIHLRFYHDINLKPQDQLDGSIITMEDIAVRPIIKTVRGLYYNEEKRALTNKITTVTPVEIKFKNESKWLKGIVYQGNFYKR